MPVHYIKRLIAGGEGQTLDFKFEISDYSKIARTLAAFANTDGGKLLIGVKDNGAIAGVRSEEEYFMIEGAASMYCRPPVDFRSTEWDVDGKKVLEIDVDKGMTSDPHYAPDKEGKWKVYIRQKDQNLLADKLLLKVWKRQSGKKGTFIRFRENEKLLLEYLEEHGRITRSKFRKVAKISNHRAEIILVNFIMLDILGMEITEKVTYFYLKDDYDQKIKEFD
jgi:predicted HTH transcriptional regulator